MPIQKVIELDLEAHQGPFVVTSDTGRAYFVGSESRGRRPFIFEYGEQLIGKKMVAYSGDMRKGSIVEVITSDGMYISFKVGEVARLGV